MNKEKKKQLTLRRACDDLLIGFVVGYVMLVVLLKVLEVMKVIEYDNFQPTMIIAVVNI